MEFVGHANSPTTVLSNAEAATAKDFGLFPPSTIFEILKSKVEIGANLAAGNLVGSSGKHVSLLLLKIAKTFRFEVLVMNCKYP